MTKARGRISSGRNPRQEPKPPTPRTWRGRWRAWLGWWGSCSPPPATHSAPATNMFPSFILVSYCCLVPQPLSFSLNCQQGLLFLCSFCKLWLLWVCMCSLPSHTCSSSVSTARWLGCHDYPPAEDRCAEAIVCQDRFRAVSEISPSWPQQTTLFQCYRSGNGQEALGSSRFPNGPWWTPELSFPRAAFILHS